MGAFAGLVSRPARDAVVPVALHLDHGSSYRLCKKCIREGYTSVMIDSSLLSHNGNVTLIQRVVAMAHGLPVGVKLRIVGGKEDHHESGILYIDLKEAAEFVREMGISAYDRGYQTYRELYRRLEPMMRGSAGE